MRINLDSDGVIYDLTGEMAKLAKLAAKDAGLEDRDFGHPEQWSVSQAWGVPSKFVTAIFETEGLFLTGEPYPGAIEAVNYLAERHDVRIVTHKAGLPDAGRARRETVEWYDRHGLTNKVDLVFARGDKTSYPADVVVDDKPTLAWAQPEPTLNVLFAQPWNTSVYQGNLDPSLVYRFAKAYDWSDVVYFIESEECRRTA